MIVTLLLVAFFCATAVIDIRAWPDTARIVRGVVAVLLVLLLLAGKSLGL